MKVNNLAEYKATEAMGIFPVIPVLVVGGLAAATALGLYGVNRVTRPEYAQQVAQPVASATQNIAITGLFLAALYFIATSPEDKPK